MRAPVWLVCAIARWVLPVADARAPDFIVGQPHDPYLRRWYLTPWSGLYRGVENPTRWQRIVRCLPNVYLHQFLRDDDDRAHHDHPWPSVSLLLSGAYVEHTIAPGGIHRTRSSWAGELRLRSAAFTHRLALMRWGGQINDRGDWVDSLLPCWTLFITGFATRGPHTRKRGDWGFHCPERGWVHYREFTDTRDGVSVTGRGCG